MRREWGEKAGAGGAGGEAEVETPGSGMESAPPGAGATQRSSPSLHAEGRCCPAWGATPGQLCVSPSKDEENKAQKSERNLLAFVKMEQRSWGQSRGPAL